MKKIITFILCLALMITGVVTVASAETSAETSAQSSAGTETAYGTIPEEYDATTYPWALFSEGEFLGAFKYYTNSTDSSYGAYSSYSDGDTINHVIFWLYKNKDTYAGKDMQILLRTDYTTSKPNDVIDNDPGETMWEEFAFGKLTFDLGGNTFTQGNDTITPLIRIFLNGNGTNASALNVDVKNGTLIAKHKYGPLFYIGANSTNKAPGAHLGINITATDVTFSTVSTADGHTDVGFFGAAVSNATFVNYPVNVIFNNCVLPESNHYNTGNLTYLNFFSANINCKSAELEKTGVYTSGDFTADVTVTNAYNIATTLTLEIAQNGTALTTETLDVVAGNTDKTLSALANITSTEGTLTVTLKSGETVLKEIVLEALACDGENHIYDQQIIDAAYLKSEADCQSAATYYVSCACGAHDTEISQTFTSGEKNPYKHTGTLVNNVYDCCGKSLATEYGIISEAFENAETYPWAIFVFNEETKVYDFVTATQYYAYNSKQIYQDNYYALGVLSGNSALCNKDVVVLLRSDYAVSNNDKFDNGQTPWAGYNFKSLTFDLGGHSWTTNTNNFIKLHFNNNDNPYLLNVHVKNGTITSTGSKYGLLLHIHDHAGSASNGTGGHLGTNIKVSNVNFIPVKTDVDGGDLGFIGSSIYKTNVDKYKDYPINIEYENCSIVTANAYGTNIYNNMYDSIQVKVVNEVCNHYDNNGDLCCDFCGEALDVILAGYSTTLSENIGINFYAKLSDKVAKVTVTVAGKIQTIIISGEAALTSGEFAGCYKLSSVVSSINMREDITITFLDEDENALQIISSKGITTSYTTSVFAYANRLIADENQSDEVKEVAKALLNYGAYAEEYFEKDYSGENVYSEEYKALVTADTVTASGTVAATGDTSVLGNVQLVLDNATKIRIFINAEVITVSGTDADKVSIFDTYIEIQGIDAANLDTVYSFTVNGAEVQISATGAAAYVVNSGAFDEAAVNLMKALYLYAISVNELPESV